MKKILIVLSISFVVLVLTSCNRSDTSNMLYIEVPQNIDNELKLDMLSKSIKIVKLETNSEVLISRISEVYFFGGLLYVVDGTGRVLIFDDDGKYIKSLGKKGDGPGEYRFLTGFAWDSRTGNFFLGSGGKVMVFSENHELLIERKLPTNFDFLEYSDGNLKAITQMYDIKVDGGYFNQTVLYTMDSELDILDTLMLRKVFLEKRSASTLGYRHYWSGYNLKKFVYTPVTTNEPILRDTLFEYIDNKLEPFAKLNFPKPNKDEKGNKIYWICNIVNTSNYITSHYFKSGNEIMMLIFDKKNERAYNFELGILDDDGDRVLLRPLDTVHNVFYFVKNSKYASKEFEEQNPIIGIVKLK
ncbi:hypothetical protein A3SI_12109 [Nitritalea halalkaliphila LW7]|uniref:6-bladed beta-propeller n=1 Tax=Nitritalea halalkaliphila LW7 TaxID=1189621 RepID=I5C1U5_9BACT|nr:6-bladed beta-propeller [Nitritalea halalkaliphila]EIM75797.1 hypothetical protein A3SI_12109 [Nitritalea halalkaliphila LW7]